MDIRIFKKLIKEAVKEAIQEELKEVLLEAVKAPKVAPVGVGGYGIANQPIAEGAVGSSLTGINAREKYRELLGNMMDIRNGNISMTANNALGFGQQAGYKPPVSVNTTTEGSALPAGEVNLDQIMGLINKK